MDPVLSHVKATDVITVDRQWSARLHCSLKFMGRSRARNRRGRCGAGDVADSAGAGIAGGAPAAGPRDGCAADCTLCEVRES